MKFKRVVVAVLVGLTCFVVLLFGFLASGKVSAADPSLRVCLDPGHGNNTGAYNATYDLWEDDINLDVAFRLQTLLEANGYDVSLTRVLESTNPSNRDRYSFCNDKAADILISVHTNSSTNSDIDGILMLYFQGDDKVLAGAMHEMMLPALGDVSWPFTDFGLDKFASGVLMKSNMPATMLEPVLMSYDEEAQLLDDTGESSRRQEIAQAAYEGIVNYFTNYSGGDDGGGNGGGGNCPPRGNKPGC